MADFYHGSPVSFDEFDQSRIKAGAGSSSQIQFGLGHYAVQDMTRAGLWITGSPQYGGVISRFSVDDKVLQDKFIAHNRQLSAESISSLTESAKTNGYPKVAEELQNLSKSTGGKVMGADLANITKYNTDAAIHLRKEGFLGFTFETDGGRGKMEKNAVFLDAKDIPATTPIVTPEYMKAATEKGQKIDPARVPPALQQRTDAFLQLVDKKGQELGISTEELGKVKGRVSNLARSASDITNYNGKSQIHPLKLTESALRTDFGMNPKLAEALRPDAEKFVHDGMKSLGLQPKAPILTEVIAAQNGGKTQISAPSQSEPVKSIPAHLVIPSSTSPVSFGSPQTYVRNQPGLSPSTKSGVIELITEAEAGLKNKDPAAYEKMRSAVNILNHTGTPVRADVKAALEQAERATGLAAGRTPQEIEDIIKARDMAASRSPRQAGEGFIDYKDRIFAAHDKAHPNPTEHQARAFNQALNDSLFYDAPHGYESRPERVEGMLRNQAPADTRHYNQAIEYERTAGTLHSTSEFKTAIKEHTGRMGQAGKASLPGMAATAGGALLVAGTMAAKGASAAEIGKEVKEQITPQVVKHAAAGDSAKVAAELGGGALATATGAALGGAAAGLACGPASPVCSTLGAAAGGILGATGLHEPAKKGLETAILEARKGVEWALAKIDPYASERQQKLDNLLGSNVVGRVSSYSTAAPDQPKQVQPAVKQDQVLKL